MNNVADSMARSAVGSNDNVKDYSFGKINGIISKEFLQGSTFSSQLGVRELASSIDLDPSFRLSGLHTLSVPVVGVGLSFK